MESGRNGFANTSMSKQLEKDLKPLKINYNLFKLYRKEDSRVSKDSTKMIKYSCGCTIVRCATDLEASCKKCNGYFEMN